MNCGDGNVYASPVIATPLNQFEQQQLLHQSRMGTSGDKPEGNQLPQTSPNTVPRTATAPLPGNNGVLINDSLKHERGLDEGFEGRSTSQDKLVVDTEGSSDDDEVAKTNSNANALSVSMRAKKQRMGLSQTPVDDLDRERPMSWEGELSEIDKGSSIHGGGSARRPSDGCSDQESILKTGSTDSMDTLKMEPGSPMLVNESEEETPDVKPVMLIKDGYKIPPPFPSPTLTASHPILTFSSTPIHQPHPTHHSHLHESSSHPSVLVHPHFTPTQSPLQLRIQQAQQIRLDHNQSGYSSSSSPEQARHLFYSPTQSPVQSRQLGLHQGSPGCKRGKEAMAPIGLISQPPHHAFSPNQSPVQSRHVSSQGESSPYSSPYSSVGSPSGSSHQYSPNQSPVLNRHNLVPQSATGAPSLAGTNSVSYANHSSPLMLAKANDSFQSGSHYNLSPHPISLISNRFDGGLDLTDDDRNLPPDLAQHAALAGQTGISRQQLINSPCPICGDRISGFHYGIFSCESCKGFFKRTVQNKKNYVCLRGANCPVSITTRKKCPACRFEKCLKRGMKLEAIREDRTRGGRSTYQCSYTLPSGVLAEGGAIDQPNPNPLNHLATNKEERDADRELNRAAGPSTSGSQPLFNGSSGSRREAGGSSKLAAVRSSLPNNGAYVPVLIQEIMAVEHLWHVTESDQPRVLSNALPTALKPMAESAGSASAPTGAAASGVGGGPDFFSNLCNIADHRLYRIVKWCKSLPLFKNIQIDDQICLLLNSWCELLLLSCCYRSIPTPGEIRVSQGRTLTLAQARQLGLCPVIERMLNLTEHLRRLKVDQCEYVCLKVVILLTCDVVGLKESEQVRHAQEKVIQALQTYTLAHYPSQSSKFGELLLRIPELQRTCQIGKELLAVKHKEGEMPGFNLLLELLRGEH